MNVEKESDEERELFERMPQHPSREQLMAEVAVLTEMVRVLSARVAELEKPWVGLTDEEIVYLSKTVGNGVINDGRFARAIEAKLKEKNK